MQVSADYLGYPLLPLCHRKGGRLDVITCKQPFNMWKADYEGLRFNLHYSLTPSSSPLHQEIKAR